MEDFLKEMDTFDYKPRGGGGGSRRRKRREVFDDSDDEFVRAQCSCLSEL